MDNVLKLQETRRKKDCSSTFILSKPSLNLLQSCLLLLERSRKVWWCIVKSRTEKITDADDKVMIMSAAKDNRDGDDEDDSMTFSR